MNLLCIIICDLITSQRNVRVSFGHPLLSVIYMKMSCKGTIWKPPVFKIQANLDTKSWLPLKYLGFFYH